MIAAAAVLAGSRIRRRFLVDFVEAGFAGCFEEAESSVDLAVGCLLKLLKTVRCQVPKCCPAETGAVVAVLGQTVLVVD